LHRSNKSNIHGVAPKEKWLTFPDKGHFVQLSKMKQISGTQMNNLRTRTIYAIHNHTLIHTQNNLITKLNNHTLIHCNKLNINSKRDQSHKQNTKIHYIQSHNLNNKEPKVYCVARGSQW
jgi:hypothetical protein